MLHVICTRLRLGHLSVRVGDSSRPCEEIVKISNSTFECDYYYYYYYYYYIKMVETNRTMRGNDGKTTSKSGLALNEIAYYGKLRTVMSRGSWL